MVDEHKDAGHHGFILGILIGILIALLFTTQKGRKLLKVITSEGSRKFGNWEEMIAILEREIGEDSPLEEEPVVGEEPATPLRTSSAKEEKKVLRQAQDENENIEVVKEERKPEPEPESTPAPEPIPEPEKLEKIDTEHLEQEITELKEELKEVKKDIEEEKPAPKKKSRFFKGIRKK